MAFRFRLQAVLRFRQGMERKQELLLQHANMIVLSLTNDIDRLNHRLQALNAHQIQELEEGSTSAQLHFHQFSRDAILRQRPLLEQQLFEAKEICRLRSEAFMHARQEREVVDTLGKQELREYEIQQTREQQQRLDDLFLARRAFPKRG